MERTYELYKSDSGIGIVAIDPDGLTHGIPYDEGNSDYQAYLKWVAEGNEATVIEAEKN
jgi:hypothetical protein